MFRDAGVRGPPQSELPVPADRQHRYAIVIGIDRYPGFRDLGGACNDAEAFAEWLTDPNGGDVPAENVRTLLGRGLITEVATDAETGAILYGTTDLLLTNLGINSLDELPPISPLLDDGQEGFDRD